MTRPRLALDQEVENELATLSDASQLATATAACSELVVVKAKDLLDSLEPSALTQTPLARSYSRR